MSQIIKGRVENRAELAGTFGVSVVTVDSWVELGCPFNSRPAGKGSAWSFNTADISKWLVQRAVETALGKVERMEADEAKRRKLAADAGLAELELDQKRGDLAPVAVMVAWVETKLAMTRERLLGVPGKLSGELEPEQSERLTEELHEAMEELSDAARAFEGTEPLSGEDRDGMADPQATASPEPDRVGRKVPVRRAKDKCGSRKVADKRPARRVRPNGGRHGK